MLTNLNSNLNVVDSYIALRASSYCTSLRRWELSYFQYRFELPEYLDFDFNVFTVVTVALFKYIYYIQ